MDTKTVPSIPSESAPSAFIALYLGDSVCSARLVGITRESAIVRQVARHLRGILNAEQKRIVGLPTAFSNWLWKR